MRRFVLGERSLRSDQKSVGCTYLLATYDGSTYRSIPDDLVMLEEASDALEERSRELNVRPFMSLVDTLDVAVEYAEDDAALASFGVSLDEDGDPIPDPSTGLPYSVDLINWTPIAEGLPTLRALADDGHVEPDVRGELREVLHYLEAAPPHASLALRLIF